MITATQAIPNHDPRMKAPAHTMTLVREDRYRRRIRCETDGGTAFLLDLPEATYLADGDGVLLENGEVVAIKAADEPLLEVTAHHPRDFARIAWHIGNRHTPAEITADALYIQQDHVLADMLVGLGASLKEVTRPFEPEGGAYGGHGSLHESHHTHTHHPTH